MTSRLEGAQFQLTIYSEYLSKAKTSLEQYQSRPRDMTSTLVRESYQTSIPVFFEQVKYYQELVDTWQKEVDRLS